MEHPEIHGSVGGETKEMEEIKAKKKKKPTRLLCEMRIEVELVVNVNWKILIVQVMRRFYLVY